MELWPILPDTFKTSVVKKLDYKSRCRLRKCSKTERSLVDSCPVFIKHVNFEPRVGNVIYFSIEELGFPCEILNDKACNTQEVLQDFLLLFKNAKSKVTQLSIAHYNFQRQPDAVNDFIAFLLNEIGSQYPNSFKLKIQKLEFHWGEMKDTSLLSLLKIFDPKVFNALHLRNFPIRTPVLIEELLETEQWKNLKDIQIQEKLALPLNIFHPKNVLSVTFHSLRADDAWNCIQNFQFKPRPFQSFFRIFTTTDLSLSEIFSQCNVPAKNEPIEKSHYLNDYFKHTQRFQLTWTQECILVVKIAKRQIKGTICRKEFLVDDFDELDDL
ncbi:hypothetical protein GCK72_019982 [Caenorhabditis remanei]|uniref:F-box domain-containing protein n=1 Tax=Caenorhabditis remanei TaxID=31234 RepID=A0A6A5GFF4_CAERE|nr:hypothetical protein GCK72_019982 [Caenorhabditis remanei]KAF1753425.1 hypothetical protein GCK72_019982 [Caenorhabditis remanei]